MTPLLTLTALGIRYPGARPPALSDLGLALFAGEKLAVIGESGSGKSTLARALAGLLPAGTEVSGRIDWTEPLPRPGRDIGYVFQDPGGSLNPLLSVGRHLDEVLRTHLPLSRKAARTRAAELLERVRIPDPDRALAAYPHQFSGGQRQRIAIALAIAAGPRLLIADEATSALDVLVQAEIAELLRGLVEAGGMTLLFITHDMALAGGLADRIAVLHDGRLIETGPAARVLHRPREAYTRTLLAAHLDLSSPRLVGDAP
ncbi:ABC transporter ATP-binding protein [Rhodovulum sulfidophilum]|uniref:ABC transporter ATP-binding protein n=1 Tax=Rhodovulum sulfidophilum TaxID=35806 RepID=UPI001F1E1D85|nr:ABC transporter ATP-binding protein [Rhodovulum sulfidophilum]MCE8433428.1 ABC transporter ATP-binding protein [Rhodovulum sulfidophilum]MCF4117559.1 ABC transporter ATP-binding protein [Rhodovulum sulfidophilum]